MKTVRKARSVALALCLVLLPTLALAEVSVVVGRDGQARRVLVLSRGAGHGKVIWGQVRPRVPLDQMLNPLGDTYGDFAPTIAMNRATGGTPWAFWSMNVANQKRIGFSLWDGRRWTPATFVVADPGPYFQDELDPSATFGANGSPYLVWWRAERVATIYFSTLVNGTWTKPLALTDGTVDSRKPALTLDGTSLVVSYGTPSGPVTQTYDTAVLVESAANLMDSPIPPGRQGDPGSGSGGGGGGGPLPDKRKH